MGAAIATEQAEAARPESGPVGLVVSSTAALDTRRGSDRGAKSASRLAAALGNWLKRGLIFQIQNAGMPGERGLWWYFAAGSCLGIWICASWGCTQRRGREPREIGCVSGGSNFSFTGADCVVLTRLKSGGPLYAGRNLRVVEGRSVLIGPTDVRAFHVCPRLSLGGFCVLTLSLRNVFFIFVLLHV